MIVVFVVDTSPSMGQPLVGDGSSERSSGMSRLDLAKMAVESLAKGLRKRVSEHNGQFQQETPAMQQSLHNLGLGHVANDQFLLLSTARQKSTHPGTAACGAGGRLLVGYGDSMDFNADHTVETPLLLGHRGGFDRSLKQLKATPQGQPFPEDGGGGAVGLNIAMNNGIKLMSRYRLNNRNTENFGLGRLPSSAMAVNALMPACLILLTDVECLNKTAAEGGGKLQLQFGSGPLREFYQEPFRWDQRIFCLGVGAPGGVTSLQYMPDDLKRLCDVTGGSHTMLRSATGLSQVVDSLLKLIAPSRPRVMPIQYPLRTSTPPPALESHSRLSPGLFVNGGPICCFQALEAGVNGEPSPTQRAMLLYVPHEQPQATPNVETSQVPSYSPPVWCIPEAFFPSKVLDALPPRLAQPLLRFSGNYLVIGSHTFDPGVVMRLLQRLDQLTLANRDLAQTASTSAQQQPPVKLLHRDVYICEWLSHDGKTISPPKSARPMEYYPVCVQGADRPLHEGDEHYLNIGILHVPLVCQTNIASVAQSKLCTLTLLPPEPQMLLPLLVNAAEAEHRILRKAFEAKEASGRCGATAGLIQKQASSAGPKSVPLDEHWRSDFRAYLFRIPPYYHNALNRSLRPVLPASAHSLLNLDGIETLASLCLSIVCLQKIRNGEQVARDTNDRLERQEADLRRRGVQPMEVTSKTTPNARHLSAESAKSNQPIIGYGQYDPRNSTTSFLAALRTMPAPWRVKGVPRTKEKDVSMVENTSQEASDTGSIASLRDPPAKTVVDILGDLPADCLVPYYESRRRWIFGGSGLTTRGLHVEGVSNDGSNVQHYDAHQKTEGESLLSLAGVGASTLNTTTTAKMGDFRERLLWSRAPVVGYGSNDAAGVSATTSPDGSPKWSVDDDALPMSFFNQRTGEFTDSVQTRVSSRLMVNFGNPFKDKRGDAIVPEAFLNQSPSFKRGGDDASSDDGPLTPPGSPPHDAFTYEGEDEALFTGKPVRRPHSPRHHGSTELSMDHDTSLPPDGKRPHEDSESSGTETPEDTAAPCKKAKVMSEPASSKPSSQGAVQRPPPPPKPPQKKKPPPPPPRAPPRPPAEKRPASSETKFGVAKPPAPKSAPVEKPKPVERILSTDETANVTDQNEKQAADLQSPDSKPKVDLPPGWMCVWSKSQKRWYFFDTKTNKSVWQWPPPGGLPS